MFEGWISCSKQTFGKWCAFINVGLVPGRPEPLTKMIRWLTNSLIVYTLEDSRWPDFRPRLGRGFASHYAMRAQVCFQTPEITALWPRGDLCLPWYVRRASPNRCVAVAACMHCLCQTFLQAVELRRDPRCGSLLAASIMMLLGPMHGKRTNFWCITTRIIQKLPWQRQNRRMARKKARPSCPAARDLRFRALRHTHLSECTGVLVLDIQGVIIQVISKFSFLPISPILSEVNVAFFRPLSDVVRCFLRQEGKSRRGLL